MTDSIVSTQKQISSQESDVLKWKFTLTFNSMWYWYELADDLRVQDSLQTEMIKTYQRITGIASATPSELIKAHNLQKASNADCQDALTKALAESKKNERNKNFWKTATFAGIPITMVGTILLLAR